MTQTPYNPPTSSWSHPSIASIVASGHSPIEEIAGRARRLALKAMSDGWEGPPFDPMRLAGLLGINTSPHADIADARLITLPEKGLTIEFNPNRPIARIRYSVAHEIAHTLFPDFAEETRNRARKGEVDPESWQLEILCNIAAAEILMPIGTLHDIDDSVLTMDRLLDLRARYQVSSEAVLLRAVRVSRQAVCAFAASRRETGPSSGRYQIDYVVPTATYAPSISAGMLLPVETLLSDCTAVGFTVRGKERWPPNSEQHHVEAIGVQPYHDRIYPRVIGILKQSRPKQTATSEIKYVVGDATAPHGRDMRLLAHIVNDKTPNWGAGFPLAVKKQWPCAQEDFQHWVRLSNENLQLGNVRFTPIETNLTIAHMVSQRGYGASVKPRIRYDALADCLDAIAEHALARKASVHMPRIGTGQAGGSWEIIEELVVDKLCRRRIDVTVYDLRGAIAPPPPPSQGRLFPKA